MNVRELIDYLSGQDPDLEVEMAIVAPVDDSVDDITVDRYSIDAVMPWEGDEGGEPMIWLVGGEESDVDDFIDAIDGDGDDDAFGSDDPPGNGHGH
jgi:hypothetical protein